MSKLLALSTFLFCSISSYASSLNLIASDDARINAAQAIYLDQYILFFSEQLSFYDTNTGEFEAINFDIDLSDVDDGGEDPSPPDVSFYNIQELNGYVYFNLVVNQTYIDNTYSAVWRSNGTAAGTQEFNPQPISGLTQKNGFLLGINPDDQVWVTDGNSSYLHDVDYGQLRFVCVFAVDNIVFTGIFKPLVMPTLP